MTDKKFKRKIRKTSLCDEEISFVLKVSLSTVKRWRSGKNAPHNLARKRIFKDIKKYKKLIGDL